MPIGAARVSGALAFGSVIRCRRANRPSTEGRLDEHGRSANL
jgi:hypothetical protein